MGGVLREKEWKVRGAGGYSMVRKELTGGEDSVAQRKKEIVNGQRQ